MTFFLGKVNDFNLCLFMFILGILFEEKYLQHITFRMLISEKITNSLK